MATYTMSAPSVAPVPSLPTMGLAAHLCQRWEEMQRAQWMHQGLWQELVDLVLPGHPDITSRRSPGQSRTDKLFDTTAIQAAQILAASIMGGVTNAFLDWLKVGFRYKGLAENQTANAWLAEVDSILLGGLAASNFYQCAHTYYLHLGVFGLAAMYVDTLHQLTAAGRLEAYLRCKTLPVGSYGIQENADGRIDTLFRCMPMTPRQVVQMFGNECSPQMRELASSPTTCDQVKEIIHAVFPREDYQRGKPGNRHMPYRSVYLEYDTKHICDDSGYEEFPFLVSRWETVGADPYGFGPGHMALPDIRTMNMVRELQLRMLLLWAQPPLKARQEGVVGAISLEPLAVNVLQQMEDLQVLDITGRPDLVKLEQAELQKSIRELFFADTLAALPPVDSTNMTAYEVAQRIEIMQRLMGPAFHRLLTEFLDPLIDRVFGLFWRAGVLPPVPEEVLYAAAQNQGQLDVEYEGPLARAQRGGQVKSMAETLAVATQISVNAQQPEIWDNLDTDGILRETAEVNGTPRQYLVDKAVVRQKREARQAQQHAIMQQQLENERMKSMAPVMKAAQGMPQTQDMAVA